LEGKEAGESLEGASVLYLALCSEREERQHSRAWAEVWRRGVM
jgi:hypothetical protein